MQFFKHLIGAFVAEELGHAAVLITQVTEDNGIRGTGLTTGWNDGSVRDGDGRITVGQLKLPTAVATTCFGPSVLGFDALGGDALGAIGALLHDASHANRHFGVQLQSLEVVRRGLLARLVVVGLHLQDATIAKRVAVVVVEVVEASHLVRTVVGAVPRADAAVVHHGVEAFFVVHGGGHRTHLLARCIFTLHASDRLDGHLVELIAINLAIGFAERVVPVQTQPVHFAAAKHLVFADDRNVVFRLTRHNARGATRALVEVDGHRPAVTAIFDRVLFPLRDAVHHVRTVLGKPRVFLELVDIGLAEDGGQTLRNPHVTTGIHVNGVVVLGGGQGVGAGSLHNLGPVTHPRRSHVAKRLKAESCTTTDTTVERTAAAQRQLHGLVGHARGTKDGGFNRLAAHRNGHQVAVADAKFAGRLWTHQHRVVPSQLGDGVGQFLQPTVVGKASVPKGGGRGESQSPTFTRARKRSDRAPRHRWRDGAGGRTFDHTVVQGGTPSRGVAREVCFHLSAGRGKASRQSGEHFDRVATAEERHHQRLSNRNGTVAVGDIVPRLEPVGRWQVPR